MERKAKRTSALPVTFSLLSPCSLQSSLITTFTYSTIVDLNSHLTNVHFILLHYYYIEGVFKVNAFVLKFYICQILVFK